MPSQSHDRIWDSPSSVTPVPSQSPLVAASSLLCYESLRRIVDASAPRSLLGLSPRCDGDRIDEFVTECISSDGDASRTPGW
jgi:hypothetical protein